MSTGDHHRTAPSPGGPERPVEARLRAALAARAATVEPRDLRPAEPPRAARRTSWLRGAPWRRFALPLAAAAAAAAVALGYAALSPGTTPPRPTPATTPDPLPRPTHHGQPSPDPSPTVPDRGTPDPTRTRNPGRTISPDELVPDATASWTPSTDSRTPRSRGATPTTPAAPPSQSPPGPQQP
ncbi:hypothetical protein ACGH2B_12035 [Streptomyces sp. BBFR2]|uniref:hypothetical protein n=1 Tax=Streptomyces sp. BBFR2 TaxID=3372854 RepID=UPI0037DA2086